MPVHLVERYGPSVTSGLLPEGLSRGRQVMEHMRQKGTSVRDITSILIPAEEAGVLGLRRTAGAADSANSTTGPIPRSAQLSRRPWHAEACARPPARGSQPAD